MFDRMTVRQQQPPDAPISPGQEKVSVKKSTGIDLGSRYASQLGFDGIRLYVEDDASAPVPTESSATGSKKKKKKKRKKKKDSEKKDNDVDDDDEEGDEE
jgi:hypothetical protein